MDDKGTIDKPYVCVCVCVFVILILSMCNMVFIPFAIPQFFGDSFAYIVEKSVLDPREKTLTTFTQNITLTKFMTVEEKCIYHVADENPGW